MRNSIYLTFLLENKLNYYPVTFFMHQITAHHNYVQTPTECTSQQLWPHHHSVITRLLPALTSQEHRDVQLWNYLTKRMPADLRCAAGFFLAQKSSEQLMWATDLSVASCARPKREGKSKTLHAGVSRWPEALFRWSRTGSMNSSGRWGRLRYDFSKGHIVSVAFWVF